MGGSAHLNYTAGGLLIAGGAMGFMRAGSMASLAAGSALGGALVAAGVLCTKGRDLQGHSLALAASTCVLAAMGPRYMRSRKFMPAGAAATLGVLTALYNGKKVSDWV